MLPSFGKRVRRKAKAKLAQPLELFNNAQNQQNIKSRTTAPSMMQGVHTEKVEGGKLVRVKVEYNPEDKLIEDVQVHDDFFIYPEEFIDDI